MITARTIDARGLALRLWDHGGSGAPVLFVHGHLDGGRSFDDVIAALGPSVRGLALDFRGHGESAQIGAGGSYHLLDHLKDLSLVVTALRAEGLMPEAIVAHSMGGNIALLLAGSWPEQVKRLVLVDSLGAPPEAPEDQPARLGMLLQMLERVTPFSTVADVDEGLARLRMSNPGLTERGARSMVKHLLRPSLDQPGRLAFTYDARLKGPTPVRYPEPFYEALCKRAAMPVLVVRASDGYVPEGEPATSRLAAFPRGRLVTLTGAHHLHVDHPEALAALVAHHLTEPA
jgi:pimeloyl-ACP methyl ester carboxylesterase